MRDFYMVKVMDGGPANTVYPTEQMARARAKSLAVMTGGKVAVLRCVDICGPDKPKVEPTIVWESGAE